MSTIEALQRPERYPRSASYDPRWVMALDMGPHPLWQLEDLLPSLALVPGMRILDLGSGRGATSVFLARECELEVVACVLWVPAEEAQAVFDAAGAADRVTAVNADVRQLPFADREFDAIVSIDAFEYFGTDVHLMPLLLRLLKPGGAIGISTPALRVDPYEGPIPALRRSGRRARGGGLAFAGVVAAPLGAERSPRGCSGPLAGGRPR